MIKKFLIYSIILIYVCSILFFISSIYFLGFGILFGYSLIAKIFSFISGFTIIYMLYKPVLDSFKYILEFLLKILESKNKV